jgi:hypothetical protein
MHKGLSEELKKSMPGSHTKVVTAESLRVEAGHQSVSYSDDSNVQRELGNTSSVFFTPLQHPGSFLF